MASFALLIVLIKGLHNRSQKKCSPDTGIGELRLNGMHSDLLSCSLLDGYLTIFCVFLKNELDFIGACDA